MASTSSSAASPDTLSIAQLRARLRQVFDESCHLVPSLPEDSPHNRTLRLADIATFCAIDYRQLLKMRLDSPPKRCTRRCASVASCAKVPNCRPIPPREQDELSRFFKGWDDGRLIKGRTRFGWQILARSADDPALAQMAAAAGPETQAREFRMRIHLSSLGPRLKGA